jgi:hypothetical protein
MFVAGVVMLSFYDLQESRLNALIIHAYSGAKSISGESVLFIDLKWFGVIILTAMIWIVLDV